MSNYLDENGLARYDQRIKEHISNSIPNGVPYLTTAPTSANETGYLIFVVLNAEPSTYYNGYYYIITE